MISLHGNAIASHPLDNSPSFVIRFGTDRKRYVKAMTKRVSFLNFYREFPDAERDEGRIAEHGFRAAQVNTGHIRGKHAMGSARYSGEC